MAEPEVMLFTLRGFTESNKEGEWTIRYNTALMTATSVPNPHEVLKKNNIVMGKLIPGSLVIWRWISPRSSGRLAEIDWRNG